MRTVVAMYDRFEDAQSAVQALNEVGIRRDDINLVSRDASGEYSRYYNENRGSGQDVSDGAAAGAGIGAVLGGLGGLLLGLGALAIPGIGPVLAAGPIVTALAGAGVGAVAGGLVGALVDLGIPEQHAQYYAEGIRRGGTLVTVRTSDDMAEQARTVLNRFNPVDIENRAESWRKSNWSGFDQNAQPLNSDEMEFNRDYNRTGDYNRAGDYNRTSSVPVTGTDIDSDVNDRYNSDPGYNQDINQSGDRNYNSGMGQSGSQRGQGSDMRDDPEMRYSGDRGMDRSGMNQTDRTGWSGDRDVNRDNMDLTDDELYDDEDMGAGGVMGGMNTTGQADFNANRGVMQNSNIPVTGGFDADDDDANLDEQFDERMDQHLQDDVLGRDRAQSNIPVTGQDMNVMDMDTTSVRGWDYYDPMFHQDFLTRYGRTGNKYDYYMPAYRYGYDLAMDPRYRGQDWSGVEYQAQQDWQHRGLQGSWEDIKDAVRHAWESVTGGR